MNRKLVGSALGIALLVAFIAPVSAAPQNKSDYIVVFKDGTSETEESKKVGKAGGELKGTFKNVLNGAVVSLTEGQAKQLRADPNVDLVEQDSVVTIDDTQSWSPTSPVSWGLDRIDQATLPLNNSFSYPATAGSGVKVFVVDTGIRSSVTDLSGRVTSGCTSVGLSTCIPGNTEDDNGHGTHVSGTIAGSVYGVAKNASLVAVKVLNANGSGLTSGVIAGLDWVGTQYTSGSKAVVNMSLGGGASTALDAAVGRLITKGITVAVAAGNSSTDACKSSPSRVTAALTVGATTNTDSIASYSNYGKCVDIFAPGTNITSDWNNGGTNTISGTSMATPHVAGVAALLLGKGNYQTPAAIAQAITSTSVSKVVLPKSLQSTSTTTRLLQSPTN